jgi:AcrR family transcriptional regulator
MDQEMTSAAPTSPLRERILTAAVQVLREYGTVAATTKQIARAAGVSEGSIYNNFANKSELIAAAMGQVSSGIRDAVVALHQKAGENSVEDNLTEFAVASIAFFTDLLPITGQAMGDRALVTWLRSAVPGGPGQGPVRGVAALTGYLDTERGKGRLAASASPAYLAAALLGACQQFAFLTLLAGPQAVADGAGLAAEPEEYSRNVIRTLLTAQVDAG